MRWVWELEPDAPSGPPVRQRAVKHVLSWTARGRCRQSGRLRQRSKRETPLVCASGHKRPDRGTAWGGTSAPRYWRGEEL
jgi:hypothetical protein